MLTTRMAETSLAAYRSIEAELQPKERVVMAVFDEHTLLTREQLAQRLHWKECAVCGRVNKLVEIGKLEEIPGGTTLSGRSAKLVRLPRGQMGLF